jgi:hypothetical protein
MGAGIKREQKGDTPGQPSAPPCLQACCKFITMRQKINKATHKKLSTKDEYRKIVFDERLENLGVGL